MDVVLPDVSYLFSSFSPGISFTSGLQRIDPFECIDAILINIYDIYIYQQGDIMFNYEILLTGNNNINFQNLSK